MDRFITKESNLLSGNEVVDQDTAMGPLEILKFLKRHDCFPDAAITYTPSISENKAYRFLKKSAKLNFDH